MKAARLMTAEVAGSRQLSAESGDSQPGVLGCCLSESPGTTSTRPRLDVAVIGARLIELISR